MAINILTDEIPLSKFQAWEAIEFSAKTQEEVDDLVTDYVKNEVVALDLASEVGISYSDEETINAIAEDNQELFSNAVLFKVLEMYFGGLNDGIDSQTDLKSKRYAKKYADIRKSFSSLNKYGKTSVSYVARMSR